MSTQFQAHTLAVQYEGKVYYVAIVEEVWPIVMALICSVSKNQKLQLFEAPENTKMVTLRGVK